MRIPGGGDISLAPPVSTLPCCYTGKLIFHNDDKNDPVLGGSTVIQ